MLKGNNLDELLNNRINNFDIIRFLAATLVIFAHSYPLTGHNAEEPLGALTNGMSFGGLAVKVFFIISGFLITQSFDRSKDIKKYSIARILRIFPGLIVVVLLSMLIVGPVFTNLSLKNYFLDPKTYEYLKTIRLYHLEYYLPGVFQQNPNQAVNGSLWTLWYEFYFYIVIAVLGITRLLNRPIVLLGFLLASILFYLGRGNFYTDLFRYFSVGMLFYLFRQKIVLNGWIAALSIIILAFTAKTPYFSYLLSVLGSYIIFYLAFHKNLKFNNFGKYGDFSYGIYIYAFPIQQIAVYATDNQLSHWGNFLVSFPITLIFSVLSWHLVEKRALKLKNYSMKVKKPW
jgi:peptidoglycan/LPS O-acetylase OafA/YrhL